MLLQSAEMVAMKLLNEFLVDDKITACVGQIRLLDVICKVSKRKTLFGETFCFEKRLLSILNLILSLKKVSFLTSFCAPSIEKWYPFHIPSS